MISSFGSRITNGVIKYCHGFVRSMESMSVEMIILIIWVSLSVTVLNTLLVSWLLVLEVVYRRIHVKHHGDWMMSKYSLFDSLSDQYYK